MDRLVQPKQSPKSKKTKVHILSAEQEIYNQNGSMTIITLQWLSAVHGAQRPAPGDLNDVHQGNVVDGRNAAGKIYLCSPSTATLAACGARTYLCMRSRGVVRLHTVCRISF